MLPAPLIDGQLFLGHRKMAADYVDEMPNCKLLSFASCLQRDEPSSLDEESIWLSVQSLQDTKLFQSPNQKKKIKPAL